MIAVTQAVITKMWEESFTGRDEAISFGKDYEYLMAAYYGLVFTLNEKVKEFKISSNNKAMGDFDDVVIELELDNGEEHLFALQLKHQKRQIAQYTLVSGNKKFSLQKYNGEFGKIKNNYHKNRTQTISFENHHFILFTTSNLEKEDDFNEEWRKLKPQVNGSVVETNVFIKKCDVFGQQLFAVPGSEPQFIFRFKSSEEDSDYENFFQQFYFYTRQKNAKDVERLISDVFTNTFKNCDAAAAITYVNYINYWCRGDYGPHKLTKKDISMKIAELICVKYVPGVDISRLNYVLDERMTTFATTLGFFDIVVVENPADEVVDRIWNSLLKDLVALTKKVGVQWSTPFPSVYLNKLTKQFTVPISAYGENFNELSLKRIYFMLWHCGYCPLVVKSNENLNDIQDISHVIRLCKTNNANCNFIVLERNDSFEGESSWKILRSLSDVASNSDEIYSLIKKFAISLQGRPRITLEDFLEIDANFASAITTKEIVMMMDDNYICGKDCRKKLPKYYVSRKLPKILIDLKAINEVRNDLFILSTSEDAKVPNCGIDSVEIQKYLFLKESGHPLKLPQNDNSRCFFIIAKGGCSTHQFDEICAINQGTNCHHVRLVDDERIEWIQSRGSVDKIQQYRSNFETFQSDDFVKDEDALKYFDNKINIICADPGMGKSVMVNFLHYICPPPFWVISVQLRTHTTFFKERRSKEEILNYFLSLESADNLFAEKVVNILASKKQILFLWDGFDEVPLEYNSFVIAAINTLAEEGYFQWLAARNNSKNFLEQTFNTLSLTLTLFDRQNQYDYVYYHLKEKYKEETKVEELIDKINENISSLLTCGYVDYTGIPLQIHMLTEIYLEKHSDEETPAMVTLTDIYQEFILGKFNSLFQRAEADCENVYMQAIREQYVNIHMDIYETAAIKAAFEVEHLTDVTFNCGNFLEEIRENKDTLDLILDVNEESIFFAHKTYEEFLAASWLSKHCHRYPGLVKILFQEKYTNIRMMFDMLLAKDSPVHLAVLYRNLDVIKNHQKDIQDSEDRIGRNPLHLACSWGRRHPLLQVMNEDEEIEPTPKSREDNYNRFKDIVTIVRKINTNIPDLLEKGESSHGFKYHDDVDKIFSIIYEQSFNADKKSVSDAIKINAEKLSKIEPEDTLFLEILEYLLTHKCKAFERDDLLEWNAFEYADCSLSLAAIDILIKFHCVEMGVLQNFKDIPTVVHYSVVFLYNNLLKAIAKIPFLEYQYQFGTVTLLQVASEVNNFSAVSELLKYPYYKKVINNQGAFFNNPLGSAVFHGNLDMIDLLLENGGNVNGHKLPLLMTVSVGGRLDVCEKLLEAGADVNATSCLDGDSPLSTSVMTRRTEIAKVLLENGADVNYVNNYEFTALSLAVGCGSSDMVELILQYQPNVNRQCEKLGHSPLHTATEFGFLEIVKLLLKHGADATLKSKTLMTPLHIALYNKHKEIAIELINKTPSVANDYDEDGLNPVMLATIKNFPDIIELFSNYEADFNCSEAERSPLCYAAVHNFNSCAQALIEGGASVNKAASNGIYPIMLSMGDISTLRFFLDNSADVNVKNKEGLTPLHFAIGRGNKDAVEELIKNGASVNVGFNPCDFSKIPLSHAISFKQTEILRILLDEGAEFGNGIKLIDYALWNDFHEGVSLLVKRGVDINAKDELGYTILYKTLLSEEVQLSFDKAKVLLENGADPNTLCEPKIFSLLAKIEGSDKLIEEEKTLLSSPLHWTACQGNILATVLLIANGADVNITDQTLQTPLHYACLSKSTFQSKSLSNTEDCVKELLAKGAHVNHQDVEGRTPLHLACATSGYSNIVRLLVENEAGVNILNKQKQSPLHYCFHFGELQNADLLIQNGAKLDIEDMFGWRPVDMAMEWIIAQKNIDLADLEKLLLWGASINYRSRNNGFTLLHVAAEGGQTTLMRFLLENGAASDVDIANNEQTTPLHLACMNNYPEIVSLLLANNSQINVQNLDGFTPLHYAAHKSADIVQTLLEAGGDPNVSNKGYTPLQIACEVGNTRTCEIFFEYLKNYRTQVSEAGETLLHFAVAGSNVEVAKLLIEKGVDVNRKNSENWPPIFYACVNNNLTLIKMLKENGADIFVEHDARESLLTISCRHTSVIKYLTENGLSVNHKDENDETPLYNACIHNNYDGALYLIENGADINAATKNENITPLYTASVRGHVELVKLLLSFDANFSIKRNNDYSPLYAATGAAKLEVLELYAQELKEGRNGIVRRSEIHYEWKRCLMYASCQGHLEIVKFIHDNGLAKINDIFDNGCTPLHFACLEGKLDIVDYLLDNNAEVNAKTDEGFVPLYLIASKDHMDITKLLVEKGAEVDATCSNGNTPLFSAAAFGFVNIVEYLHNNGASVNVVDKQGDTPLHDAACRGYLPVVQYLVSKNAQVNLKNNNGKTPLDLAVEAKHTEIEEFLTSLLQEETH